MATGTLSPTIFTGLDNNGVPLNAGLLYTYSAGSTTPAATYTSVLLTPGSEHTNPIVLSSAGRAPGNEIFLSPGASYKFILKDSAGVTIWSADNISTVPASSANADVTGTAGEALLAGEVAYLSDGSGAKTAGLWWHADSANPYSSTLPQLAMVPAGISAGASGTFRLAGAMPGLSGLTIGSTYYVGTAGALTATLPHNGRAVGVADTTSSLILTPNPPAVETMNLIQLEAFL